MITLNYTFESLRVLVGFRKKQIDEFQYAGLAYVANVSCGHSWNLARNLLLMQRMKAFYTRS